MPKFAVAALVPAAPSVTPAGSVSNWSEMPFLLTRVPLMTPVAVVCAMTDAAASSSAIIARTRIVLCLLNIFKFLVRGRQKSDRLQQNLRRYGVFHLHLQGLGDGRAKIVRHIQRGESGGGQSHIVDQPCHFYRRNGINLRSQPVDRADGFSIAHEH